MDFIELLTASAVLVVVLGVGVILHELSHVIALRAFGVPCEIQWRPSADERSADVATATWGTVVPTALPKELAPWRLRVSALMPLTLALPVVLVFAGVLPDPVAGGDPVLAAATIGLLGCAIPSPQDFSLVWYADQAIDQFSV